MRYELADENASQGMKMTKSKTKVMMENDSPICQQHSDKSSTLKVTTILSRDTAPETKNQVLDWIPVIDNKT